MSAERKKHFYWAVVIVLLHLLAILCFQLNEESIYGTILSTFLSLTRSSVYIALFTAWGFSVRYRVSALYTRRYLTAEAVLLVLWLLTRTIKYIFVVEPNVNRMLWYLYYFPMLMIPVIAIFASLSLGHYGKYSLPRWTVLPGIITLLLLMLVLTNDLHQLVFSFPADAAVFSDSDYRYATGYYFVLGWGVLCLILAFAIMLYRCRLPKMRKVMWLPILPISGMLVYFILYITDNSFLNRFAGDLTVSICCLTIAAFESCIGNGLIQINAHYRELLAHADFPVCITDDAYHLYIASNCGSALTEKVAQYQEQTISLSDEKSRIRALPITGGTVFWEEDIRAIQDDILTLQDLQESLKERQTISLEEYRTSREKAHLAEVNRLYDRMQIETAGCLSKIQDLLGELSRESDASKERILLGKIAVYGAYFKRRNNLLFVAETQKRIRGAELTYCLKETFTALTYLGIHGSYEVDEQGDFTLVDIMQMYDLIQQVIEVSMDTLSAVTAIIRRSEDVLHMYISLSLKGAAPAFPDCLTVIQEEEDEYLLTWQLAGQHERGVEDDSLL